MPDTFNILDRATDRFSSLKHPTALYETYPRSLGNQNITPLSSGRISIVGIDLPAGLLVSTITFHSGSTLLVAGTNQWFGLFDSSRNKLAVTSDDTSTAWGANAAKSLNLSSPYRTTYSGLHMLGIVVAAATPISMAGLPVGGISATMIAAPAVAGSADTGLTNPASCPTTLTTVAGSGAAVMYAYVS